MTLLTTEIHNHDEPARALIVSLASNRVYTVGVRNGQWTLEALDLSTGAAAAHYEIGGPLYNTRWSGLTLDDHGRILTVIASALCGSPLNSTVSVLNQKFAEYFTA